MNNWDIKAIVRGEIRGDRSINLQYTDMGTQFWHPSTVYYLTDGEHNIVIDTGYGEPDDIEPKQPLFKLDADRSLPDLLASEAVAVEEVDILLLSHLHWDHAGNVDMFAERDIEIKIQRTAAEYAADPLDIHAAAFMSPSADYEPSWANVDFEYIEGDETILPGLKAIHTPGHSPGHTSFLVNTNKGTYGLAIDVFPLYENMEGTDAAKFHPPGTTNDRDWWHSAHRVTRAADVVIPSHDPDGPANEWVTD